MEEKGKLIKRVCKNCALHNSLGCPYSGDSVNPACDNGECDEFRLMTKDEFFDNYCMYCEKEGCRNVLSKQTRDYEQCFKYREKCLGESLFCDKEGKPKFSYAVSMVPKKGEEDLFDELRIGNEALAPKTVRVACDKIILHNNSLSLDFQVNSEVLEKCDYLELNGIKFVKQGRGTIEEFCKILLKNCKSSSSDSYSRRDIEDTEIIRLAKERFRVNLEEIE